MKSIALTLAVLFGTLSIAQAANEANQQPTTQEEVIAVEETTENPAEKKPEEEANKPAQ